MPDAVAASRPIRICAQDGSLIRALAEHRSQRQGWCIQPLDGAPELGALVILDFDAGEGQTKALDAIRAGGFSGPVVILGGSDGARTNVDEPIPRPVRLGALLARIDAHAQAIVEADAVILGPYHFIPDERVLREPAADRVIRLTELEQDFLLYLLAAEGALVGREQLLADVWGYSEGVDSHTVETHVWRLRQKIESDDPASRFLVTEAGGYRLLVGGAQEE